MIDKEMQRGAEKMPVTRPEFERDLASWLERGHTPTVGDVASFGKSAWVWVKHLGHRYYLSADSTKEGVESYLQLATTDGGMSWSIPTRKKGRRGRVGFGLEQTVIPGFNFYRKIPEM